MKLIFARPFSIEQKYNFALQLRGIIKIPLQVSSRPQNDVPHNDVPHNDVLHILIVLGHYHLVLIGIEWYWVDKGLLCLYILKKLMVTSTDRPTNRPTDRVNIE